MGYVSIKDNVTCIIPFYNEQGLNIRKIIRTVLKVNQVQKIVLIDDGSDSIKTFNFLQKQFSKNENVKIARLTKNYGKSFAIKFGLSLCFSDNILLLDADLKDVNSTEISNAISTFRLLRLDMVILRRVNSLPLVKFIRADTLLSGERIIKKTHLKKILDLEVDGYQLEVATNQYFINKGLGYKCFWSPSSAINNYKHKKHRFFSGVLKDIKMYTELMRYIGLRNYSKQVFKFCKEKA